MMQEATHRAPADSLCTRWRLRLTVAAMVVAAVLTPLTARADLLNQAACDACVAAILAGEPGWSLPTPTDPEG